MKHFRKLASVLSATVLVVIQLGVSAPASAAANCSVDPNSSKGQALQGIGVTGTTDCGAGVTNVISSVVNILSIVLGIAAVIMIIIAAFKFISSGGDANAVKSARETLIYALIGLVVAALAQFLVHFAINTSLRATPGSCQVAGKTSLAASDSNCK